MPGRAAPAKWTAPTDYSSLEFDPTYGNYKQLRVHGSLSFGLTVKVKDFDNKVSTKTSTVIANLFGTIDMGVQPPKYSDS